MCEHPPFKTMFCPVCGKLGLPADLKATSILTRNERVTEFYETGDPETMRGKTSQTL